MKYLFIFIPAICLYLLSCHHNRVSIKIKNTSSYDYKRVTARFGDTLQVIDTLLSGDKTRRFYSNSTHGRGFTKVILMNGDTLVYSGLDMKGKKIYYRGKILVKINIGKSKEERDTILIKTRRRIIF